MRTAHFTLAELPGTLAIFVTGIAVGTALFNRQVRLFAVPVALIAAIAVVATA